MSVKRYPSVPGIRSIPAEEAGKKLFVTGGIGTSILPVRFRVPPEIVVLTLS